jgi:hypothetical protein
VVADVNEDLCGLQGRPHRFHGRFRRNQPQGRGRFSKAWRSSLVTRSSVQSARSTREVSAGILRPVWGIGNHDLRGAWGGYSKPEHPCRRARSKCICVGCGKPFPWATREQLIARPYNLFDHESGLSGADRARCRGGDRRAIEARGARNRCRPYQSWRANSGPRTWTVGFGSTNPHQCDVR